MINFLVADDHSLIRQGVVFLIEDLDIEVNIIQISNLQNILETVKNQPLDIAIIDAYFPDGNSLTILPEIKKLNPNLKILIFTGIEENIHSLKYINAGANGFLSKMSEEDEIRDAILKMVNTGEYLSPITQHLLLSSLHDKKSINPLSILSERELQIAKMYAEGLGNLEIANVLDIKQNTVSTIKKRIFDKLGIQNIVELIDLMKNNVFG